MHYLCVADERRDAPDSRRGAFWFRDHESQSVYRKTFDNGLLLRTASAVHEKKSVDVGQELRIGPNKSVVRYTLLEKESIKHLELPCSDSPL